MKRLGVARSVSVVLAAALALLFLPPNLVSAQSATRTYSLAKTFSTPFACNAVPTTPTFPATRSPAPGECVAVNIAITNTSAIPNIITSLSLSDALPASLIGQTGSCSPVVSILYTCFVSATSFTFSTNGTPYRLDPGQTGSENFIVQVSPTAAIGSTISNTATATVAGPTGTFTGSPATAVLTVGGTVVTPTQSFTLAKTFSQPFNCATGPAGGTLTGFAQTQAAAPGQCVAVRLTVANSATSTLPVTSFTLGDALPAALIGRPGTCQPIISPANCNVGTTSFAFNSNGAAYSLAPGGPSAFEVFVVQVAAGATCGSTIANTGTGSAANGSTAFTQINTGLATSSLVVTCGTPTPPLTVTKLASVNGLGFYTSPPNAASPNASIRYWIRITNNTGTSVTGATITDYIAPGQTIAIPQGFPCNYDAGTRIVTCTNVTLAPGNNDLFLTTVAGNTSQVIQNTAQVTVPGVATFTSNTTFVTVAGTPVVNPGPGAGSVLVCGIVTAFQPPTLTTGGSLTIGGLVIPIAANASIVANPPSALYPGSNTCVRITVSGGQAIAIVATSNVPTVALVCGTFTATSTTTGFIVVGGMQVPVVAGATFMVTLIVNVTYCFLLVNGHAFAFLTGIPTSIKPIHKHHGYAYREGFTRAE